MAKMDSLLLKSKFRGSLLGALMGDCLGSAYEGEELFTAGMKLVIQRSFDKLEGPHFKAPVMQFTDDSAMTTAVAESLIEHKGFDQKNMATKFVKSYYKEPNRGYGAGVTTVFHKLRNNKFVDILGPAREQFSGEGSLGNGGAMRAAPVALFCYKNYDLMVDIARKQSQITHTHKTGVDGAILQAIAVHQSLLLNPKEKLDIRRFTDDLIAKMDKIEADDEGLGLVDPSPYKSQLKLVKDLISEDGDGDGPHDEKVVHHLGTDISALHSVPTAIYCFLRAQRPVKPITTENPLRRTVQYANTNCDTTQFGHIGCETSAKKVVQHSKGPPAARDLRYGENNSYCEELDDEQSYSSVSLEQCSPVNLSLSKKANNRDWSYPNHSNLGYQSTLLDRSMYLSQRGKYDSPEPFRIRIPWNMHSLQLSDYCSKNITKRSRLGVQFILSNDSLLSERSSSTIVCVKRSDSTCTPMKSFTECGMQCDSSDSKESSPISCNALTVGKETRDSAISVEYDDHDIFAKSIAYYLRTMDVETALRAQSQIQKVIDDHRLHKPETQSIRLFRPEISERSTMQRGNCQFKKSHCVVATTRPIQRTSSQRSSREIQHTVKPNKVIGRNNTIPREIQELKLKARKFLLVNDPVITHYERIASTSRAAKPGATDRVISLGGDTDTIGSMAGAIAGAFYGEEMISHEILKHCESSSEFTNLADQLFDLASA